MPNKKLTIKYQEGLGELTFSYDNHFLKYVGYEMAKLLRKRLDDQLITFEEYASIKVELNYKEDEQKTNNKIHKQKESLQA